MECYECCSPRIIGCLKVFDGSYIFLCKSCMNKYVLLNEKKPTEPTETTEPKYEPIAKERLTPLQELDKLKPKSAKKRIVFHWRGKHE